MTSPLAAQATDQAPAPVVSDVVACQTVTDPAQRLTCYDTAVAALAKAQAAKDVVVVTREDVRAARRGLFGFTLPKLRLFGGGDDDSGQEDIREINAVIVSASQAGNGNWLLDLGENGTWQQTDSEFIGSPDPGDALLIRRASLGGYFGRLNSRGFRIRRVR